MSDVNLVDETEAAICLCFSKSKLQKMRYAGDGPAYIKIGQHIRYRIVDLDDFVLERGRGATNAESRHSFRR